MYPFKVSYDKVFTTGILKGMSVPCEFGICEIESARSLKQDALTQKIKKEAFGKDEYFIANVKVRMVK